MFGLLYASLYQGTLRGKAHEILVFTNLIANCDRDGYVDRHFNAIAEEVGLTRAEVERAIQNLEAPDPESRSTEFGGARLVRIDKHRTWGWRIVNKPKYRGIRDTEARREANRIAQQNYRNKSKQTSSGVSSDNQTSESPSVYVSASSSFQEGESKGETQPAPSPPQKATRFQKPTPEELHLHCQKIGLPEAEETKFFNYYESNGWRVGKNPMRSWAHALQNWKIHWDQNRPATALATTKPLNGAELIIRGKELERVQTAISNIKASYADHQVFSNEDRDRLKTLRARQAELKKDLGCQE